MSVKSKRRHGTGKRYRRGDWSIISWLRFRKFKQRGNLRIETNDDVEADAVAECYRTGKTVIKSRKKEEDKFNGYCNGCGMLHENCICKISTMF